MKTFLIDIPRRRQWQRDHKECHAIFKFVEKPHKITWRRYSLTSPKWRLPTLNKYSGSKELNLRKSLCLLRRATVYRRRDLAVSCIWAAKDVKFYHWGKNCHWQSPVRVCTVKHIFKAVLMNLYLKSVAFTSLCDVQVSKLVLLASIFYFFLLNIWNESSHKLTCTNMHGKISAQPHTIYKTYWNYYYRLNIFCDSKSIHA